MSRCFPFPPPGYEKKLTIDERDLLKKEKHKEKKHKKDKKDKEKKDGKEKREKDRSEGKHKEKKEKKDKHRDKKKDKDKSKHNISDEKKLNGQFEGYNGEKPHHNSEHNKDGEYNEPFQKKKEPIKEKSIPFHAQNGVFVQNRIKVGDAENFKFVQELDRRIRDEKKEMDSHQFVVDVRKNSDNKVEIHKSVMRQAIMDVAGFGGNVAVLSKINGVIPQPPLDNKIDRRIEKMQEKGSDDKRGDKRKHKDRDKEGKHKDREKEKIEKSKKKSEHKKAEKDKNKHMKKIDLHPLENSFQGVGNEGNLKKRKDMEPNGVSHENELRPNKMARSISNIPPENGRKVDCLQYPSPSLLGKQVASLNNFKVGSNGGQKVNGMIPSQPVSLPAKKPPIPAFNHIPSKPSPIKSPPVITNHVAIQSPPVHTTKPQPNHVPAHPPTSEPPPPHPPAKPPVTRPKPPPQPQPPLSIPKKKPHPDTKYLNQILSITKPDPWCDYDDQEWLFSSKSGQPSSKKPITEKVEVQVWSKAKHIESVDVCALPYVIPY